MRVLIIEDEKPAARYLNRMIDAIGGLEVISLIHSVEDAIYWFKSNTHPELIFLDIQLSDGLSFEIFDAVEVTSAIIFTTAYDEYALQAFKLNSIDYLLKPIDEEELATALQKYISFKPIESNINISLQEVKKLFIGNEAPAYKTRYTIRVGQHLKVVRIEEIECIYSENKATYIHTVSGRTYLLDQSLEQVVQELNPKQFFRVSRKHIVQIDAIKDIIAYTNSRLRLVLHNYPDKDLIVSREKVKLFKDWLS